MLLGSSSVCQIPAGNPEGLVLAHLIEMWLEGCPNPITLFNFHDSRSRKKEK
jgi:hypothetical protein